MLELSGIYWSYHEGWYWHVLLIRQMLTFDWDCRLAAAQDGWYDQRIRMTDTDGGLGVSDSRPRSDG
jgi:hypothetical protein